MGDLMVLFAVQAVTWKLDSKPQRKIIAFVTSDTDGFEMFKIKRERASSVAPRNRSIT